MKRWIVSAILVALTTSCSPHAATGSGFLPSSADGNAASPIAISGTGVDRELDRMVVAFMLRDRVPNAQLAVSTHGKTTFSHAYTYAGLAGSQTTTQTLMRLASNTKAWTSAAMYNLISTGAVDPNAKVFAYLGLTKPLPEGAKVDPRVYDITIEDMIQHKSGWDDGVPPHYDPSYAMRRTALALGLTHEIDQTQYVRFQLHQPLQEKPGTHFAYCNFCYDVLGMVVAKASGMTYERYVQKYVAGPIGASFFISPTLDPRLPGEVAHYYSIHKGLSAIFVTSMKLWPDPYGVGGTDEVAQGDGGAATNAESMLALMNHYVIWGVGKAPHHQTWAREGEMAGSHTYAEQTAPGINWAFEINADDHTNPGFDRLQGRFEKHLTGKCLLSC